MRKFIIICAAVMLIGISPQKAHAMTVRTDIDLTVTKYSDGCIEITADVHKAGKLLYSKKAVKMRKYKSHEKAKTWFISIQDDKKILSALEKKRTLSDKLIWNTIIREYGKYKIGGVKELKKAYKKYTSRGMALHILNVLYYNRNEERGIIYGN